MGSLNGSLEDRSQEPPLDERHLRHCHNPFLQVSFLEHLQGQRSLGRRGSPHQEPPGTAGT